ncbi:hypothetical protein GW17_00034566 [Ensete ventricosum]|nr:hypothetical protein GW17_00034566 [Ensete ventricosum]
MAMAMAAAEFPTLHAPRPVSKALTLVPVAGFSLLIAFSENPRCDGDAFLIIFTTTIISLTLVNRHISLADLLQRSTLPSADRNNDLLVAYTPAAITVAPYRCYYRPHLSPVVHAVAATIVATFLYHNDLSLPSLPLIATHNPLSLAPTVAAICPSVVSSLSLPYPFFPSVTASIAACMTLPASTTVISHCHLYPRIATSLASCCPLLPLLVDSHRCWLSTPPPAAVAKMLALGSLAASLPLFPTVVDHEPLAIPLCSSLPSSFSPRPHRCFLCLSFVSNTRTAEKESLAIRPQKPPLLLLPLPPSPFSLSATEASLLEMMLPASPSSNAPSTVAHNHYDIILAAITILAASSLALCRLTSRVSFPSDHINCAALSSVTQQHKQATIFPPYHDRNRAIFVPQLLPSSSFVGHTNTALCLCPRYLLRWSHQCFPLAFVHCCHLPPSSTASTLPPSSIHHTAPALPHDLLQRSMLPLVNHRNDFFPLIVALQLSLSQPRRSHPCSIIAPSPFLATKTATIDHNHD